MVRAVAPHAHAAHRCRHGRSSGCHFQSADRRSYFCARSAGARYFSCIAHSAVHQFCNRCIGFDISSGKKRGILFFDSGTIQLQQSSVLRNSWHCMRIGFGVFPAYKQLDRKRRSENQEEKMESHSWRNFSRIIDFYFSTTLW
ncbi:hypothetical protein SDC9_54471 [bioreactor metagenome]|uniref:Uncharacterized protein n=1 Tax=bioreactor metagenome TaxID=1076179 RepID=A0A644WWI7_9ZZZZ